MRKWILIFLLQGYLMAVTLLEVEGKWDQKDFLYFLSREKRLPIGLLQNFIF